MKFRIEFGSSTGEPEFSNAILWCWRMGCIGIECLRGCEIAVLMGGDLGVCKWAEEVNLQVLLINKLTN